MIQSKLYTSKFKNRFLANPSMVIFSIAEAGHIRRMIWPMQAVGKMAVMGPAKSRLLSLLVYTWRMAKKNGGIMRVLFIAAMALSLVDVALHAKQEKQAHK